MAASRSELWRPGLSLETSKAAQERPVLRERKGENGEQATRPFLPNDACASSAKVGAEAKRRYGTTSRSHATRPISFVCAIANETAPSAKKATETVRRGRAVRRRAWAACVARSGRRRRTTRPHRRRTQAWSCRGPRLLEDQQPGEHHEDGSRARPSVRKRAAASAAIGSTATGEDDAVATPTMPLTTTMPAATNASATKGSRPDSFSRRAVMGNQRGAKTKFATTKPPGWTGP
jgi:hypothetical protein